MGSLIGNFSFIVTLCRQANELSRRIDFNIDFNRAATDLTVFDVRLTGHAAIDENLEGFTAMGTLHC